ncbi:uncharacterized protein DNG_01088 [Cephalotrichum gorgonifer]|uniref:Uncharacterized protein n=1 Tax=Cephalotrichum gorgonifer TaxID=2041049 RepID=A0AAE8SRY3_9PEZI|nr:uncharacterized protein DNG_01088 [Cephalotrichum gorgonifer]
MTSTLSLRTAGDLVDRNKMMPITRTMGGPPGPATGGRGLDFKPVKLNPRRPALVLG